MLLTVLNGAGSLPNGLHNMKKITFFITALAMLFMLIFHVVSYYVNGTEPGNYMLMLYITLAVSLLGMSIEGKK